ncbi:MAG: NADH-quinone oxidoreductase subunit J family protein [Candidatus Limnocylindrales bacterium]
MPIPDTVPLVGLRWDDLLFLLLGAILLGSALLVVTMRDIIRAGLAMIASFAALAGIYVLLGAPLVAATQVLVYIGAISVLILFAIMLTQTKNAPAVLVFQTQTWAAAIAAVVLALAIGLTVTATAWPTVAAERIWTVTAKVADVLFNAYVLPFEVVSVLLLAAVVGGVFLARREERGGERP